MLNRAREMWENLGRNNQIILVASSLAVLIALLGFVAWASTPEYVPLFSSLSAQDSNAIIDKLKESNIPYKLDTSGSAIQVPSQYQAELRMKLISQGLAQHSSASLDSDDVLKGSNTFETQPMQELRMLRSNENQIGKSIMSLDQVASASVHVAPAEDTPFISTKHEATASVLVTLKPGASLSDENVQAIVRMTQMGYTGLTEKNISVVDAHGSLLFDGTHSGNMEGSSRLKQQRAIAEAKRVELQGLLDTIGPHKAVVIVNPELNFDQEEIDKKSTETGAITSRTTETEKMSGPGPAKNLAAGANANIPPANPATGGAPGVPTYPGGGQAEGSGTFDHNTSTTTSDPTVTTTRIVKAPGRIEKLTVSALVDSKVPPEQVAAIKQALETAIAVDPNDPTHARLVSVAQVPFDRSAEETETKAAAAARGAESMARMVSIAVPLTLMVVCLLLMARALRKPMRLVSSQQLALAGGGGRGLALPAGDIGHLLDMESAPLAGQTVGSVLQGETDPIALGSHSTNSFEVIEQSFDAHLQSILHLTHSKPETVAALIKSWVSDEKS